MARRIHLQPYLSVDELEQRYRTAKEPNERTWWQILWLLAQGRTATELAAVIGYRAYWIGQIAKRYNEQGPEGMHNRRHTTSYRPAPVLSAEQLEDLHAAFSEAAAQHQHWTGTEVATWMSQRLGRRSPTIWGGAIWSNSSTAGKCPGLSTHWPIPRNRRSSKKTTPPCKRGRYRISSGAGRAVGNG